MQNQILKVKGFSRDGGNKIAEEKGDDFPTAITERNEWKEDKS